MLSKENSYDINLKFEEGVTQQIGSFQRVYGLVKVRHLVRLIEVVDLDSNPRNSKAGSITADIVESLERYPDTFPLMTKGILLSSMNFRPLDRNRYQLRFEDKAIEGIVDGGHNLLAVGMYILSEAISSASLNEKIGSQIIFSKFKGLFKQYFAEIDAYLQDPKNNLVLDRLVPVELILPRSDSDVDQLVFRDTLPLIQQARNNNAQLKDQTLADHAGIFEELKNAVEPELRASIEWKTNDGGTVDVRDLIALTWLPLSSLDFDVHNKAGKRISPPNAPQLYSSKATVLNRYVDFMESPDVGRTPAGEKYELTNELVRKALETSSVLPNLYDQVSQFVERIFDAASPKTKFANLTVVEASNKQKQPLLKFSRKEASIAVPDGFVWPIVVGFKALIERNSDGAPVWGTDPIIFLHDHWRELSDSYYQVLETGQFDPQKVGKSSLSYSLFHHNIEAIFERIK